ncbi:MAG: hypothetical protein PUI99_10925 [Clostridiales bacterium]|nr:hypothetical protein [Clostridiales bacterium]
MALKLRSFVLEGDTLILRGYLDTVDGKPRFDIRFTVTAPVDRILPEEMNELARNMQDELYGMMVPEPVKCEDGEDYFFPRNYVIERFLKDNGEEVQGDDRTQESAASRKDAQ